MTGLHARPLHRPGAGSLGPAGLPPPGPPFRREDSGARCSPAAERTEERGGGPGRPGRSRPRPRRGSRAHRGGPGAGPPRPRSSAGEEDDEGAVERVHPLVVEGDAAVAVEEGGPVEDHAAGRGDARRRGSQQRPPRPGSAMPWAPRPRAPTRASGRGGSLPSPLRADTTRMKRQVVPRRAAATPSASIRRASTSFFGAAALVTSSCRAMERMDAGSLCNPRSSGTVRGWNSPGSPPGRERPRPEEPLRLEQPTGFGTPQAPGGDGFIGTPLAMEDGMARRLRVAQLIQYFGIGGIERMVEGLVPAFALREVDTAVAAYRGDGPVREALLARGASAVLLPGRAGLDPCSPSALARWIRHTGADVLHTHHLGPFLYGAAAAPPRRRSARPHRALPRDLRRSTPPGAGPPHGRPRHRGRRLRGDRLLAGVGPRAPLHRRPQRGSGSSPGHRRGPGARPRGPGRRRTRRRRRLRGAARPEKDSTARSSAHSTPHCPPRRGFA